MIVQLLDHKMYAICLCKVILVEEARQETKSWKSFLCLYLGFWTLKIFWVSNDRHMREAFHIDLLNQNTNES